MRIASEATLASPTQAVLEQALDLCSPGSGTRSRRSGPAFVVTRERAMPHDLPAEREILGSVLVTNDLLSRAVDSGLTSEDFFDQGHRLIWDAMLALYQRHEPHHIDTITLSAELNRRDVLQRVGGRAYISSLISDIPTMANIASYVHIVKRASSLRDLIKVCDSTIKTAMAQGADPTDLCEQLRTSLDTAAPVAGAASTNPLPIDVLDLLNMEIPPREWLLEGFIQRRDIAELHAWRGVGKTRIAHGIAVAVASGCPFLRFKAPEPHGVLLVDGELPREQLQEMLRQAGDAASSPLRAPLQVLSADLADAILPSLADEQGRRVVERHLDGISLLILDSISTLCPGSGKENEAGSWDTMQAWLLELRRKGTTTLFVHHDGKSGGQRGTSKREDIVSQAVQLKRPPDYRPSQGCRVEVHFTKSRGLIGSETEPFEASLMPGGPTGPQWTWRSLQDTRAEQAAELSATGMTQREIAEEWGWVWVL